MKHFAGNEAEFERMTISSVIDERTLREIYLVPFELAVREGGSLGVMTAYNRVNGTALLGTRRLVTDILRGEWGFDGFVVTDWFSAGSTVGSASAGVDLEMPGPGRFYGNALADAVRDGSVTEATLDAQVRRLLSVFERVGALDDPPDVAPTSVDRPEHRALARRAATEAIVLLRNDAVLPFTEESIGSLALIGPNAEWQQIMGGGSAALAPHYRVGLLDALRQRLGDRVEIRHERGLVFGNAGARLAGPSVVTPDGAPGFAAELFADVGFAGDVVYRTTFNDGRLLLVTDSPGVPEGALSMRVRARFTPAESGIHIFTLVEAGGHARLSVDGDVVIDGFADPPPPGQELFGMGSEEVAVEIELTAGTPVDLLIEYEAAAPGFFRGAKIACRRPNPPDLLDRAVAAAAAADAVVVVVGTDDEWESEGHDRPTMDLPGRTGRLGGADRGGQPQHRGRGEQRLAGDHAVGPGRAGRDAGVVRGTGGRQRHRRRPASVTPSPVAGCPRPCRCGSSTTRRSATSPARTAKSATAKACWWGTAGTKRATSPRVSRSGTACRTPRTRSANQRCLPR